MPNGLRWMLSTALLFLLSAHCGAVGSVSEQLRLSVRTAPIPVRIDKELRVLHELHIQNLGSERVELRTVTLQHVNAKKQQLVRLAAEQMQANTQIFDAGYRALGRDFLPPEDLPPLTLDAQMIAVVFFSFAIDEKAPVTATFSHELSFSRANKTLQIAGGEFSLSGSTAVAIAAPLPGGPWWSYESVRNDAVHRRALVLEVADIAQRYAVDYMKLGDNDSAFAGDPSVNNNWFGYGEPVLAVADGVITDIKDGIPDNIPLSGKRVVDMSHDTINGNYVILDIGQGYYAVYGHLISGSLKVSLGQRVQRGQVLGALGNSGNSSAPHLHFHLGSENRVFAAEGKPFVYEQYRLLGTAEPGPPPRVRIDDQQGELRTNEMPDGFTIVRFPSAQEK